MDMNNGRIRPYEGPEPYIFISYSHRDQDIVEPLMRGLADRGYRIWYDEGIDPGTEWPESIARHLENSRVCLYFITPESASSPNCRREVNFAVSRNTDLLTVFLEQTQISPGLEMQISTYQSIMGYEYPEDAELLDRIVSVDLLQPCRETPEGEKVSVRRKRSSVPSGKGSAPLVTGLLILLAAAAAILWFLYGYGAGEDAPGVPAPAATATPQPTATPRPSATPEPTSTPAPTATPAPIETPEPTPSPDPTEEPEPEETPEVPGTPVPEIPPEDEYDWYTPEHDGGPDGPDDPVPEGEPVPEYGEQ